MSDNNIGSSPAVASAAASSASTKRSHNEMETTEYNELSTSNNEASISNNTKIDNDALFASGMEKIILAKKELALAQKRVELAQQHMEGIRQQIRDSGEYEPDSLLFLCDGEDNNILSLIMGYLAVEEVGRCEVVCSVLKKQAVKYWENLDTLLFANHPTLRSPSAQSPREAAIRYKVASRLAERIGDMGDSISRHSVVSESNRNTYTTTYKRIHDECLGCDFPNLNFEPFIPETSDEYPFRSETSDEYELFLRFCRTSDNKLLAEGFVPCSYETEEGHYGGDKDWSRLHLRKLDFSNWPQFVEVTRLIETSEGNPFDNEHNDNLLDACMSELTVVVGSVHKGTSEASLSIAQCNFGGNEGWQFDDSEGYCMCRKGRMSVKSHGSVETKCIQHETSAALVNRLCEASMELTWRSHVRTDLDSGEILKKDCFWALDCTCFYEDKDFYGERYQREMS